MKFCRSRGTINSDAAAAADCFCIKYQWIVIYSLLPYVFVVVFFSLFILLHCLLACLLVGLFGIEGDEGDLFFAKFFTDMLLCCCCCCC